MGKNSVLWTRNFTIITVGSVVSMLGSAISGFALGLLVLDLTKSTFYFAMYMFLYTFPRIIVPILAGPFVDKFSRRRTIYTLDFLSAGLYGLFAVMSGTGHFNFILLAIGCVFLGTIDSVYRVAYDSFYPMLISEGQFSKAYSVASVLETLTAVMVPVSALLYNTVGIVPLFIGDAVSFLIAAIFETQIHYKEEFHEARRGETYSGKKYLSDFKEGLNYLKSEPGLMAIALYFGFAAFGGGSTQVLGLPYFKGNFSHGEYVYIGVMAGAVLGRFIGGSIYYKFKWPDNKKFTIALIVYISMCVIEGSYLYAPVYVMFFMCFVIGLMGVTSYNIRISSTQSYVPHERKGRYNGTFEMISTVGMILGELASGALSIVLSERIIVSIMMGINLLAAIFIMGRHRKDVSLIYNRTA